MHRNAGYPTRFTRRRDYCVNNRLQGLASRQNHVASAASRAFLSLLRRKSQNCTQHLIWGLLIRYNNSLSAKHISINMQEYAKTLAASYWPFVPSMSYQNKTANAPTFPLPCPPVTRQQHHHVPTPAETPLPPFFPRTPSSLPPATSHVMATTCPQEPPHPRSYLLLRYLAPSSAHSIPQYSMTGSNAPHMSLYVHVRKLTHTLPELPRVDNRCPCCTPWCASLEASNRQTSITPLASSTNFTPS